jgi:hypothetical protein
MKKREGYWDYMGRKLREDTSRMTLINPSEYSDNEVTIDSVSNRILLIRQQLLGLEDLLKKYINQTISQDDRNLDKINKTYYYANGKRWKFVDGQLVVAEEQLELGLDV